MIIFSYLLKTFFLLFRHCLNLVCFLKSGKHLSRSATIRLSTAVSAEECIELIHSFIRVNGTGSPQHVQLLYHHSCIRKSLLPEPFSSEGLCSFFLKFPETVRAEEEDQVGLQAPEDPHDSSTDTCLTFPYSSNSPIRVSPLFIATSNSSSNNSPIYRSIGHNSPAPASSTPPVLTSSQTFTSIPPTQTTNPSNNPFYTPYFSSSFSHTGPIVFPGGPPEFPYFGVPLPGSSSTFPKTASLPSYPIPSMVTPTAKPIPFFPIEPQSITGFGPYRRHGRGSRGTHSGRGRAPRDRRGRTTSTTSCQTSSIPSYSWPGYQPSLVSSRGPSAGEALNLGTMPRAFDHFPGSLPSSPLHYDYFTVLRAASPAVIFHCPSPFTQQSFSSVYSISFPHGHDTKSLLVAGINQ